MITLTEKAVSWEELCYDLRNRKSRI